MFKPYNHVWPKTTEQLALSFLKLQIYGKLFPGCFKGTKMHINLKKKIDLLIMKEVKVFKYCNLCLACVKPNIEAHSRVFLGYSRYVQWLY